MGSDFIVHSSTCFKSNKIIIRRQNAAIILAKHVRSCRVCSVLSPLKPSVPFLGPLIKQFEREQRSNLRRNFAVATLLTASIFWSFFANFRNTLSDNREMLVSRLKTHQNAPSRAKFRAVPNCFH